MPRTGVIWNYYDTVDESSKTAECSYCKKFFSFKSTVTNLKYHLRLKHPGIYEELLKRKRNETMFDSKGEYKLVLCVRTDLQMSKGKIAAQCGHAAVGCFEKAQRKDPDGLRRWQMDGQAKIALKTDSVDEIKQMADNAKKMGLVTSLIRDAGRTQIAPNSITVLGVGPAPKEIIDKVTGHLKLL